MYNGIRGRLNKVKIKYKNTKTGCVVLTHKNYTKRRENEKVKINLEKLLKQDSADFDIYFNVYNFDDQYNAEIHTKNRIATIISSDITNPFNKIYDFLKVYDQEDILYKKDIGA